MKEEKCINYRNIYISLFKFVSSCLVVFLHIDFNGNIGTFLECLARFAVPFFFAVSGYYSFKVRGEKLKKRIVKFLIILLVSNFFYLGWNLFYHCYHCKEPIGEYLKVLFSIKRIAEFFFMEYSFTSGHLWYISSMIYVYLIFYIYTTFYKKEDLPDYKMLYVISLCAFFIQIAFGVKALDLGLGNLHKLYRNSLFFGLPMFSMGLFIREYKERILNNFFFTNKKKVAVFILVCIALSEIQYFGMGITELPLTMIFVVFTVLLLATVSERKSNAKLNKLAVLLDDSSLAVYVIHVLIRDILLAYNKQYNTFSVLIEKNLFPLMVLLISVVLSFIYVYYASIMRKI